MAIVVMAGLDPAIHVFNVAALKDVDARVSALRAGPGMTRVEWIN